jgi:hypothetical protein
MVFFDDVTDGLNPQSAHCLAHVRPLSELESDLQSGNVAQYNFITPDLCGDMHDSCAPQNNPVRQGDDWLAAHVPQILASQAFQQGGALFITWDESEPALSCPFATCSIGMIVLSPLAKGHGYASDVPFTHSSTLRTVEEIFGVQPYLRDAAQSNDLRDLFAIF